jgi:hypothetical protein
LTIPELLERPTLGATPAQIELSTANDVAVHMAVATFNGSAAARSFLPCLALYSPSGTLISRTFPRGVVAVGDLADVTFAPGLSDTADDFGPADIYHKISAASTNAAVIKAEAALFTGYMIVNTAAQFSYVKLYDKATTPTVGTDTPAVVIGVPPASAANVTIAPPAEFLTGLGIATTTGIADSDSGAVAANDLAITIYFV